MSGVNELQNNIVASRLSIQKCVSACVTWTFYSAFFGLISLNFVDNNGIDSIYCKWLFTCKLRQGNSVQCIVVPRVVGYYELMAKWQQTGSRKQLVQRTPVTFSQPSWPAGWTAFHFHHTGIDEWTTIICVSDTVSVTTVSAVLTYFVRIQSTISDDEQVDWFVVCRFVLLATSAWVAQWSPR